MSKRKKEEDAKVTTDQGWIPTFQDNEREEDTEAATDPGLILTFQDNIILTQVMQLASCPINYDPNQDATKQFASFLHLHLDRLVPVGAIPQVPIINGCPRPVTPIIYHHLSSVELDRITRYCNSLFSSWGNELKSRNLTAGYAFVIRGVGRGEIHMEAQYIAPFICEP